MTRVFGLERRHRHLRKKVCGTKDKPRLCIHRSIKNITVQFIDDIDGKTILGISTSSPEIAKTLKTTGNVKQAGAFGVLVADQAKKLGITKVVFDRGGYLYHGRVKAFAEAARKGGLLF